jgi:voltage-gated potassium channel
MGAIETKPGSTGYQMFMLVLCLYALAVLAAQVAIDLEPETRDILHYADYAVCGLFFVDFVVSLIRAPSRWRYLISWGWIDLLSSIPVLEFARWGRLARILRILRVIRGLRATKILTTLVLQRRAENTFLAASLVALLLVVSCSVAVLHFETAPDSNIKTAEDAIWWSFATITTVGYGDRYPVTSEGRFVAAILMCSGVGLFGTFSGFLAAWFLGTGESSRQSELDALQGEIKALRTLLEAGIGKGDSALTSPPASCA